MITPERVYEVFGISPAPWKLNQIEGYCIDNILDQKDGVIITCDVPLVAKHDNSYLIKSCPEMLVSLIKDWNFIETFLSIEADNILPASYLMFTERQVKIQEAIESADSKGRKWHEILKSLEV